MIEEMRSSNRLLTLLKKQEYKHPLEAGGAGGGGVGEIDVIEEEEGAPKANDLGERVKSELR